MKRLKLDPDNANLGTDEGRALVRESLLRCGAGRSILADKNGVLMAGNKTYEQALELGLEIEEIETTGDKLIVIIRKDLDLETDSKAKELAIADNRTSEIGLKWSLPTLEKIAEEADFSWLFPDGIYGEEGEAEASDNREDDGGGGEDPNQIEPRCQPGEVWRLGRHRLLCGDSCDEDLVIRFLSDVTPEVLWSDPPYGMNCQQKDGSIGGGSGEIEAKNYPIIHGDNDKTIAIASFKLYNKLFPKVPQIWWGANHYSECFPSSPCWIVWDKQNGETDFADAELAWTNSNTAVRVFRWTWNGYVKQGEASQEKRCHPNQKPVEMVSWYWDNYANNTKLMFDPFLGSGTTIMAAQKHPERMVYGMEIMPEYCEVVLRRWEKVTGGVAEKV